MGSFFSDGLTPKKVAEYLDRRKLEFQSIDTALKDGDERAIHMIVHKIKGNAALYGLPKLGLMAESVIKGIEAHDWSIISQAAEDMRKMIESERAQLEVPK